MTLAPVRCFLFRRLQYVQYSFMPSYRHLFDFHYSLLGSSTFDHLDYSCPRLFSHVLSLMDKSSSNALFCPIMTQPFICHHGMDGLASSCLSNWKHYCYGPTHSFAPLPGLTKMNEQVNSCTRSSNRNDYRFTISRCRFAN